MEDEPILLKALTIMLAGGGYQVVSSDNGKDGLELVKAEKPDLLLLDLLMPVMDGFEVLQELQSTHLIKSLPVIALTNLGQDEDKKKAIALGAKYFFVKSATNLDDLIALIGKIIP